MKLIILGVEARIRFFSAAAVIAAACVVAGCGGGLPAIPAAEQPLSKDTLMMLGRKGMDASAPMYVRIFKEESELEVWKQRADGHYYHFKTYPICNWSGDVGPKTATGDRQAPEGFYRISEEQLNPNSQFYLAFNLGYPNAYDRVHDRTGAALMIHGDCKSAGCYAMTDALIEEIYALAREALKGGQPAFEVHAFPFRMTAENMARYKKHKWAKFWATMKQGYDHFEKTRVPPTVAICERKYVVNVKLPSRALKPDGACPRFQRPAATPFVPLPAEQQIAEERISVPGRKLHESSLSSIAQSVVPEDAAGEPANTVAAVASGTSRGRTGSISGPEMAPASALGFSQ